MASYVVDLFKVNKNINKLANAYRRAVGLRENNITAYAEMEKIGLDQNGATWFGKIVKDNRLFPLIEFLRDKMDFGTAIFEVETIEKDNTFYVYEINPRPPAWIDATIEAGINFPDAVVRGKVSYPEFVKKEIYFGRESKHFILKNFEFNTKIQLFAKAAAYKDRITNYPSDILLKT